jgi:protein phosphatase
MELPAPTVVMLVGAAASGKSTWARERFLETEIVSSDHCRALVSDREDDQSSTPHAFAIFHEILCRRAALGRRSVADSTGLQPFARARIRRIGEQFRIPVIAVAFPVPLDLLLTRNSQRRRSVPEHVLRMQAGWMERILQDGVLTSEGYDRIHLVEPGDDPSILPTHGEGAERL